MDLGFLQVISNKLNEKQIESQMIDWLNYQPSCFAFKVNTMGVFDPVRKSYRRLGKHVIAGTSDIIGVCEGIMFAIEVKKDIKVGEKVSLKNIHFEKGHSYITPESYVELNKLVQYMLRHPGIEIRINGHSDNTGLEFKNQRISEQRARAVFEYLIGKGVQNKMYFKGFGSKQAIADNNTEEGKAKNRRVEFEVVKQ